MPNERQTDGNEPCDRTETKDRTCCITKDGDQSQQSTSAGQQTKTNGHFAKAVPDPPGKADAADLPDIICQTLPEQPKPVLPAGSTR